VLQKLRKPGAKNALHACYVYFLLYSKNTFYIGYMYIICKFI